MTTQEAKTFGRTKTLKATALIVFILLVVLMIVQTRGDFANGILFFIEAISNPHFLVILIILLGLTFLFSGMAGKEIILGKKNFVLVSLKYVALIILIIIIYAAVVGVIMDKTSASNNLQRLVKTYFLTALANTGALAIVPMLAIWLWATNEMRLQVTKKQK